MDLLTKEDLKARIGIDDSTDNAVIDEIIAIVSAKVEKYLGRSALTTTYTEYFNVGVGSACFPLKAFPVTSITTVHNDIDWSFAATTLVDATNYTVDTSSGLLYVEPDCLICGFRALKVVYVGGMADTTSSFKTSYPDVYDAALLQVAYQYQTRKQIGAQSINSITGGVTWVGDVEFLSSVKATLDRHKRLV